MEAFLNKHRIAKKDKGIKPTHTGMHTELGSYAIPEADLPEFYSLIVSSLESKLLYSIVECIPDKTGYKKLMIDLDFKQLERIRVITEENIDKIGSAIVDSLHELFGVDTVRVIVQQRKSKHLEEATGKDAGKYKDGLHIICPDILLRIEEQLIFRTKLIENWGTQIFGTLFCNNYLEIVDKSVIDNLSDIVLFNILIKFS